MMWAACCLAFFGFLRSSEFTIPTQSGYDPEVHLSPNDVAVDNRAKPRLLKVTIKQSKTDPFRQGVILCFGENGLTALSSGCALTVPCSQGQSGGPFIHWGRWEETNSPVIQ